MTTMETRVPPGAELKLDGVTVYGRLEIIQGGGKITITNCTLEPQAPTTRRVSRVG